jgi:hypothetical protein
MSGVLAAAFSAASSSSVAAASSSSSCNTICPRSRALRSERPPNSARRSFSISSLRWATSGIRAGVHSPHPSRNGLGLDTGSALGEDHRMRAVKIGRKGIEG